MKKRVLKYGECAGDVVYRCEAVDDLEEDDRWEIGKKYIYIKKWFNVKLEDAFEKVEESKIWVNYTHINEYEVVGDWVVGDVMSYSNYFSDPELCKNWVRLRQVLTVKEALRLNKLKEI